MSSEKRVAMKADHLAWAYAVAANNWLLWREDYECGNARRLPVLTEHARWDFFVTEYSVFRGVIGPLRERIKDVFLNTQRFANAVRDDTGAELEQLAIYLAGMGHQIGTQRSLVSKLASFAKPQTFIAWDATARHGLRLLDYGHDANSYPEFLKRVNALWRDHYGEQIKRFSSNQRLRGVPTTRVAFQRRMLDVHLMTMGNRWM